MFGCLRHLMSHKNVDNSYEINYNISEKDFKKLIYEWNIRFPIDRFYRDKYNIKFNSPEHRDLSFIDMAFEFFEDRIYEELVDVNKEKYIPNVGDYIKDNNTNIGEELSNEQLMELFKTSVVKKFDDKIEEKFKEDGRQTN